MLLDDPASVNDHSGSADECSSHALSQLDPLGYVEYCVLCPIASGEVPS